MRVLLLAEKVLSSSSETLLGDYKYILPSDKPNFSPIRMQMVCRKFDPYFLIHYSVPRPRCIYTFFRVLLLIYPPSLPYFRLACSETTRICFISSTRNEGLYFFPYLTFSPLLFPPPSLSICLSVCLFLYPLPLTLAEDPETNRSLCFTRSRERAMFFSYYFFLSFFRNTSVRQPCPSLRVRTRESCAKFNCRLNIITTNHAQIRHNPYKLYTRAFRWEYSILYCVGETHKC